MDKINNEMEQILNDQTGGNLTENKGEQLVKREQVRGTPFEIIELENNIPFIALGTWKVFEEDGYTTEQLKEKIYNLDYDFLICLISTVTHVQETLKIKK